jgi:hypothetical protein
VAPSERPTVARALTVSKITLSKGRLWVESSRKMTSTASIVARVMIVAAR